MRILILDDDQARHDWYNAVYREKFGPSVVIRNALTYSQFCGYLGRESPYDLIHLDHDLGFSHEPDVYEVAPGAVLEFTGQDAADRIAELPARLRPHTVVVHSMNPLGARAIWTILNRAGVPSVVRPFNPA